MKGNFLTWTIPALLVVAACVDFERGHILSGFIDLLWLASALFCRCYEKKITKAARL